jgi:hypothetical protein
MNNIKNATSILAVLVMIGFSSPAMAEKIYRWVDEHGVVGFTDNPSRLPEKYQGSVESYGEAETQPGERATILGGPDETESNFPEDLDFNGHNREWWENRVRDMNVQKEALLIEKKRLQEEHDVSYNIWLNPFAPGNQNIGKINDAIRQGQRPDPKLFFGLPIPEPEIGQNLDDIKNQIAQVDNELSEIDHALNVDLPDEARRAGAPPGWLRD